MKIKSIFLIAIFFIAIFLWQGCENTISDKIIDKINEKCSGKDTCIINIAKVTDFDWDRMYVFKIGAKLEEINKVLGFHYPVWENAHRIVFMKGKTMVYHEDNSEHSDENYFRLIFDMTGNYKMYEKNNSTFKVTKKYQDYYELVLLKRN